MRPTIRNLQGNSGTEGPTSLLFFDSESWMRKAGPRSPRTDGRLRLWVAQYVRREGTTFRPPVTYRGRTSEEFWHLAERLSDWRRPLWAFCHNAGHDLTQLDFWTQLQTRRWTAGPVERRPHPDTGKKKGPWRGRLVVEGRPTFLVLRGRRGILKIIDTYNYWPSGLDKIGHAFGIPKMPSPDFNGPEGPLWPYCERDVDVCRVAVSELLKFWIREDCGTFKETGPMLAMQTFKHWCCGDGKHAGAAPIVLRDDCPARAVERASYLGGRIEPFYIGTLTKPIYKLDCNSLYGWIMTGRLYPRRWEGRIRQPTPEKVRRKLRAFGVVADVRIVTGKDGDTYPVKHNGVQYHACGTFWSTLAGPELARALGRGHVDQVGEAHYFSMADLFTVWAARWLDRTVEAKRAGDPARAEFCKLMYKSLPGKFGQRGDSWMDDNSRVVDPLWGRVYRRTLRRKRVIEWRSVGGHVQRREAGREPGNAFPAISAYVTSYSREYMRWVFQQMPERSLLYTATDSIICTLPGLQALERLGLIHPDEPGKFRHEDTFGEAEICGPNWYRLDEQWAASGLWGKARWETGKGYVCDVWDRLPTLLQRNPGGVCGFTTYQLREIVPTEKNEPGPDGWRVPKRLSPDFDFSDRPPRLRPPVVAER